MRTFIAFALILLSANQIFGHTHNCIHDSIEHEFVHHQVPTDAEPAKRDLAETTWTPIRIVPNYDFLTGLTDDQTAFIKNKLMPDVITFFSKTVSVLRYNSAGNITLPSGKCGDMTVPATYINPGVNGDLVLFIQATQTGWALATASHCFLGNDKRPIAGKVNFNAKTVSSNPADYTGQLGVIQHEITHVLGFSSALFQYWKSAPRNTQSINWRGTKGTILNTTRIAETARRHFNCSNITGVEVENQGGSLGSSLGSHWEKRVLGNEALTSTIGNDNVYSSFTLALLEDSGWYKANYSMAVPLQFGKNKGCSYIFQTCIDTATKQSRFSDFCVPSTEATCIPDGSAKGQCGGIKTNSSVYNYFGDNTTGLGTFEDECPTYSPYSNGYCSDVTQTPAFFLPEKFGATSKCLTGTLLQNRYVKNGKIKAGCYNSTCSVVNNVKKISFTIDNIVYECPKTGAQLANIPGHSGYLTCPDADLYCFTPSTEIINPNLPA